jgi:uncharacterized protein (DUF433 family)
MAKQATSIRLSPELKDGLEQRARDTGVSPASLYERFIAEGLRQDTHPLIVFRDGSAGRRAALAGSRLTVAQVIDTLEASDSEPADAAEYLDIPMAQVLACVRYYADYRAEVDEWRQRVAEIAEREQEAWRREQAVLA